MLLRTGVAFSDMKNAVSAIAGKAVFFVDSRHSHNAIGMAGQRRGELDINRVINGLSSAQNGAAVFSASTGSESSYFYSGLPGDMAQFALRRRIAQISSL